MQKKTSNAGGPETGAYEVHSLLSTGWTLMSIFDEQAPAMADAAALARASRHGGIRVLEASWDSRSRRRSVAVIYEPSPEEPTTPQKAPTTEISAPAASVLNGAWAGGADIRFVVFAIMAIVAAGMAAGVTLNELTRLGW